MTATATAPDVVAIRDAALRLSTAAEPHRLHILLLVAESPRYVGELCELLDGQAQPAVSHHLAILRHAGMVESSRDGKRVYYALGARGKALVDGIRALLEVES